MPHQWLSALVGPMRAAANSRADGQLHDQQAPSKGRESPAHSKHCFLAGTKNVSQAGSESNSTDSRPVCASEQQIQCPEAAEMKAQALEALESALSMHIYSTALKHLRKIFSLEVVIKQFSAILDRDDLDDMMNSSTANCLTNKEKNRSRDIVPCDSNRVELPPVAAAASKGSTIGAAGQPGSLICTNSAPSTRGNIYDDTYINSSLISDPENISKSTTSGNGNSRQAIGYIASQGPLPNTVADFWHMVASVDISAIVTLTELTMTSIGHGSSRAVCAAYFPDQLGACLNLPGGISVACVHKARLSENLLFRQLEVVCVIPQQSQQKRLWVNHYKLTDWPDFGVPRDSATVRALSHALDGCRRARCKIVVHCSAGVGRTGAFIAVDVVLQRLHNLTLQAHGSVTVDDIRAAVDILALVVGLRNQRHGTVQTRRQYAFIWQAVIDEIEALLQQERQQQQHLQQLASSLRQDLEVH